MGKRKFFFLRISLFNILRSFTEIASPQALIYVVTIAIVTDQFAISIVRIHIAYAAVGQVLNFIPVRLFMGFECNKHVSILDLKQIFGLCV